MTKEKLQLTVQLMAIEHMLAKLVAARYLEKGYTPDLIKSMHKLQLEQARQETFPQVDPALSDVAASEYEVEVGRLQQAVECLVQAAQAK